MNLSTLGLKDQLSNRLYLSKVSTFQQCPMKYYWQHHLHLDGKTRPDYFTFGSLFHKAVEFGLKYGWEIPDALLEQRNDLAATLAPKLSQKDLETFIFVPEDSRKLLLNMLDAFISKWTELSVQSVLSTENTVPMSITHLSSRFKNWYVKADFVFEDVEGVWVGDLKTTSGYGAATAKYYHSSPQTKTYARILHELIPNNKGTRIFPVTKQKVRCEEEKIILTEQDFYEADLFIEESIKAIEQAEDTQHFPRCMTACVNSYGQECPYIPICIKRIKSEAYLTDLIENWFTVSDPDDHLELKEGE